MNMCAACHQDFNSLYAFDSHQRWVKGQVVCRNPAVLGMHQDSHGRWRTGGWRTGAKPEKWLQSRRQ